MPKKTKKKTVVLDLDETLIHCNENDDAPCDFIIDLDENEPTKVPFKNIIIGFHQHPALLL
jgi:predicted HAD superfamily phosphohydrolase YqeG